MHRNGGSLFKFLSVHWYCIHTKPQREAQIAAYCQNTLNLETYYPRLRQHRTIRRVRRIVTGPLFPRYLFCRLSLTTSYRAVRYAPDVLDLVHAGGRPAEVQDTLIAELKGWAGDALDIITLQKPLRSGDAVEVVDGPMRGLSAVILHADDERDRVAVLLSILNGSAQVHLSRSQVRRIG